MEKENRKRYVRIDRETGSNQIFAMLDEIDSEAESKVENLLEDSDTEFIAEEELPEAKEEAHQILTPEAVVHIDGGSGEPPAKKRLKTKIAEMK